MRSPGQSFTPCGPPISAVMLLLRNAACRARCRGNAGCDAALQLRSAWGRSNRRRAIEGTSLYRLLGIAIMGARELALAARRSGDRSGSRVAIRARTAVLIPRDGCSGNRRHPICKLSAAGLPRSVTWMSHERCLSLRAVLNCSWRVGAGYQTTEHHP